MKYTHLLEMPHRFDEPEPTSVGKYPAHMAVALQFGKLIEQMGNRVRVPTKSDHVRFSISKEPFRVDKSDTKLVNAMRKWQAYDKIYPLNVRHFASPQDAYYYARCVLDHEWPAAEPYIMKDVRYAYWYAREVREREWPEAEPYIMKDPHTAYLYVRDIRKCREWPEAEPYIIKSPQEAYSYAKDVRKRRWPEAEPCIMTDSYFWNEYKKHFKIP